MKRILVGALALVAVFYLCSVHANADVAYSNYPFDPTPSHGWVISGPSGEYPIQYSIANQFTAAQGGRLATVTVTLDHFSGGSDWSVTLHNDDGSDNVGGAITAWSFSSAGDAETTTLVNGVPSISLSAGTKYWVSVAAASEDLYGAWRWNGPGEEGPQRYSNDDGDTWTLFGGDRGVFEVTVVSEPATLSALALGIAIFSVRRRRS
jgi:hypothetical protein